MDNHKQLELKLKDYRRFIATLILVSTYMYLGGLMNVFIQPKTDHGVELFVLSVILLAVGIAISFEYVKLKKKLEKNERT
ncbi:YrhC family protein [Ornithinibacillus caprae]|uniref:YrhC family protein n=1 Tax=Ornithinibacillus caprae TaxID=2678566 RepID=UPI0018C5F997